MIPLDITDQPNTLLKKNLGSPYPKSGMGKAFLELSLLSAIDSCHWTEGRKEIQKRAIGLWFGIFSYYTIQNMIALIVL